jgi:hypothetical protein
MLYAYAPGSVRRMNYVANNYWKMSWNITDTMQSNRKKKSDKKMQMWLRERSGQSVTHKSKGIKTRAKTHLKRKQNTGFLQLITARSTTKRSRYALGVPSLSCSYVDLLIWHKNTATVEERSVTRNISASYFVFYVNAVSKDSKNTGSAH